ncbi:F-box only protein 4 [Chanos chanos]|uniref:F-box only protein 4 n=1 Tax=Chanos chanos TaxID=29144 RepID=A0A6J2WK93_CHACN|nr:F-box only protein 4 [Chanos chanos]
MTMGESTLSQSVVIRSLRSIRDRLFSDTRKRTEDVLAPSDRNEEENTCSYLDALPVDMQFFIMAYLSAQDLCRLGATSRYWRLMIRDPLLWRYFFQRDMPLWQSIDHLSMPRLELLDAPASEGSEELQSSDYMTEYLRACPACRRQWQQPRAAYQAVASFLQSLVPSAEPRFAMIGPGLEQLEVSLMNTVMHSPDVLPVGELPKRQINGIGSGISFLFNNQHKFNIVTLYSANRTERERARIEQVNIQNKLFIQEEDTQSSSVAYSLAPQLQEVCLAMNGFIYVVNAELDGGRERERAQIRAMLDPAWGPTTRPLLVLSCVSREEGGGGRTPCVTVAHQLQLSSLPNPWMVQNTVAESLSGLLDGIEWLLRHSGFRL